MAAPRTLGIDYDVFEVAYLAGGPIRAVDTAVVALVESGRLRVVAESGELSVADPGRRHPVEAAVLDAVGIRKHRTIDTVRWRAGSDERLAAVRQRLERDALLRSGSGSSGRTRAWRALALTTEGRRTLRHLRSLVPDDRSAPGSSAMLVALCGVGVLADPVMRAAFEPPVLMRPRRGISARREQYPQDGSYYGTWAVGADGGGWGGGFCGDGGGGGGDGGGGC